MDGPAHAPVAPPTLREKRGKQFFLTVSLSVRDRESVEQCRADLLSAFDDLVSYCISLESSNNSNCEYHLHAYLEFEESYKLTELSQYIRILFDGCRIDLQACRSKKSCLKYITKEDVNPLTNIKVSSLHFNYRCYCWARNTKVFHYTDPFVVEHRFCYRYLKHYFDDFKFHEGNFFKGLFRAEHCFHNWSLDCCVWWNKYYNNFNIKRPCLYLYGPSNVGKSSFIEMLIGKNNLKYVFYPGVGKFFMQGFRDDFHKVILFEEFDIKFYVVAMLKRLCEGRDYAYPVKCEPDKNICFRGPIIFVSNFREINDEALSNRLYFVSAEVRYWQGVPAIPPKEEDGDSEKENVFSISDSEEDAGSNQGEMAENAQNSSGESQNFWESRYGFSGEIGAPSTSYRV